MEHAPRGGGGGGRPPRAGGGGGGGGAHAVTVTIHVAAEFHSYIVGKGGANVKAIREETGAQVRVPGQGSSDDAVVISGPDSKSVEKAQKAVEKIVKRQRRALSDSDKLFEGKRKGVDKHAEKRARYFKQAEEAHAAGDFEKAKKFREKAKGETLKMEAAEQKASDAIFRKKNDKDISRIDLHGLKVAEALSKLDRRLQQYQDKHPGKPLNVITGAGIHSQQGGAKIKPAVEQFLHERGLAFTVGNNGTFVVEVPQ